MLHKEIWSLLLQEFPPFTHSLTKPLLSAGYRKIQRVLMRVGNGCWSGTPAVLPSSGGDPRKGMGPVEDGDAVRAVAGASHWVRSCKHWQPRRAGGNPGHRHATASNLFFLMKPERNPQHDTMKPNEDSDQAPYTLCGSRELMPMSVQCLLRGSHKPWEGKNQRAFLLGNYFCLFTFYKKIKVPKNKRFKGTMMIIRHTENGKLLLFWKENGPTLFWGGCSFLNQWGL